MAISNSWAGELEALAASARWNLKIMIVRPGASTVVVGQGKAHIWILYRDSHFEPLEVDGDPAHSQVRKDHVAKVPDCFKLMLQQVVQRTWALRGGGKPFAQELLAPGRASARMPSSTAGALQNSGGSDAACQATVSISKSDTHSTDRSVGDIFTQELLAPGHAMRSSAPSRDGSEHPSDCTLRMSSTHRVALCGPHPPVINCNAFSGRFRIRSKGSVPSIASGTMNDSGSDTASLATSTNQAEAARHDIAALPGDSVPGIHSRGQGCTPRAPTGGTASREAGLPSIGIPVGSLGPLAPGASRMRQVASVGKSRVALCGPHPPVSNSFASSDKFRIRSKRSLPSSTSGTLQNTSESDAACQATASISKSDIHSTDRRVGVILAQELLAPGHSIRSLAPSRDGSEQFSDCTLRASSTRRVALCGPHPPVSNCNASFGKFRIRSKGSLLSIAS